MLAKDKNLIPKTKLPLTFSLNQTLMYLRFFTKFTSISFKASFTVTFIRSNDVLTGCVGMAIVEVVLAFIYLRAFSVSPEDILSAGADRHLHHGIGQTMACSFNFINHRDRIESHRLSLGFWHKCVSVLVTYLCVARFITRYTWRYTRN